MCIARVGGRSPPSMNISLKNLKNCNLLGISNIRHAISGVKNCILDQPPWRVGVRYIMKNFSATKYLAYA